MLKSLSWKKGDILLLYSDGLPEADNAKGGTLGFERSSTLIANVLTTGIFFQWDSSEIKRLFKNLVITNTQDTQVFVWKV